jgi:serpin B
MKRLLLALLISLFSLGVLTQTSTSGQVPDDTKQAVDGNTQFALDLYSRLRTKDGNLFFSPYSISTALAMTYAGARGETAREMADTLHFTLDPQRLHPAFARLMHDVQGGGQARKAQVYVANALWGQQGFRFQPEFLKLTQERYGAGLREVDFRGAAEASRLAINSWVEEQTKNKIKDLLQQGIIKSNTRLVLTNAIHFKAAWQHSFPEHLTRDETFYAAGKQGKVRMMHGSLRMGYAANDVCQVVNIPYENGEMSMLVFLPKKRDGLAELEKALTVANLKTWLGALSNHAVDLKLPKFKVTSQFSLGQTLQAMGMKTPFDPDRADFSGMSSQDPLFISAVIHKAFVDVNEKGTEAAAATAVVIASPSAAPRPLPRATFHADHPFVYVLRDNRTGSVLFVGRVSDL